MKSRLLIGIITTDCHTEYQSEILRGMISQSLKSSCDVAVICPLNNFFIEMPHKLNEKSIFKLILSDAFDGFLYDRYSLKNEKIQKYVDGLCTLSKKPVMLLDYGDHNQFETTMANDIDAFELLTDHLIDVHGCKKIYCLTGNKGVLCAEERLRGYLRSMKKHNLPIDKTYYHYGDFWITSGIELAQKILSGKLEKPDAVVCGSDIMAVSFSDTLIKGGLRVPEDIAVTGFDASMDGYQFNPSITSCKRPNYQLGAEAFRRLYRIITGRICRKVPDEVEKIRLGKSCGYSENPELKRETKRQLRNVERFRSKMSCSDMLIDISNSKDFSSLLDRINHYTYLIYKMNHMFICVTEKFLTLTDSENECTLDFECDDPVNIVYDKAAVCRNPSPGRFETSSEAIDFFRKSHKHPFAFYIFPLHYNDNFFGYAAISFRKYPMTYSDLCIQWIGYVNIAIEKVRMQSAMNIALKKLDSLAIYDELTGILSRTGFSDAFEVELSVRHECKAITYMHIELTEIKELYYKNGYERTANTIKIFSNILKSCLTEDDICGTISPICYGVVSFGADRTNALFTELKQRLQDSGSFEDSSGTSFTIGSCTCEVSDDISLPDIMYKAAVNKSSIYSKQETAVNPQFEKLCGLRNSMKKNPKLSWNISEIADKMFISKSYLQKIYKSYFNKSIIEELIQFRLDKAKKLLAETNLSVTEIANECGYSTYNYFVRQFRAAEDLSPSQFRAVHNQE